jgi:predicted dehydrogenase
MNENQVDLLESTRRDFLKQGSFAALMTMLGGVPLFAEQTSAPAGENAASGAKVKVAVIGLGTWGREILNTLALIQQAGVTAICDTYPASMRRIASAAPGATQTEDYKTILANKEISTVIIATPTHQHKEIVIEALKAGKHVYCEAPLANTIEDARTIALAAKGAKEQVFQAGLQLRSDPERHFLLPFIRSGALGTTVMGRAQWHKKVSWRSASPNPEREKAINWRLDKSISLGLIGEVGGHQLDQACLFLNSHPLSINGFSSLMLWKDGREVPDTVQAILEFPNGVRMVYDCTLANSFDTEYEMYYGSDSAVMIRDSKAWMFKEADSALYGWEVYARKDAFYKETGIALVADATKLAMRGVKQQEAAPFSDTTLNHALTAFLTRCAAVDDYHESYGAGDPDALNKHLAESHLRPYAGYLEGFQATVTAIKANEAVLSGQKLIVKPEWYELD